MSNKIRCCRAVFSDFIVSPIEGFSEHLCAVGIQRRNQLVQFTLHLTEGRSRVPGKLSKRLNSHRRQLPPTAELSPYRDLLSADGHRQKATDFTHSGTASSRDAVQRMAGYFASVFETKILRSDRARRVCSSLREK